MRKSSRNDKNDLKEIKGAIGQIKNDASLNDIKSSAALPQILGNPDPFRLRYRDAIRAIISEIVSKELSPLDAIVEIERASDVLPEQDRNRFVETVNTELLSLHDGNFARYRIRPSQFSAWKQAWNNREQ